MKRNKFESPLNPSTTDEEQLRISNVIAPRFQDRQTDILDS